MITIKRTCDNCGQEIQLVGTFSSFSSMSSTVSSSPELPIDLCEKCKVPGKYWERA